ncbi:TorD/DmsD family molecular chaperone [Methylophaga nitratireducenticrescens]|uniref:Formate dehydrogenase-specific chaperone n=1 Tax=Methylophaga nitratireducenticrescens TaxID=754476 RepID=I1XH70_METNJ|nr:molecular chaperone TorD family protein [Methylophaga nitratireducenticrescens]AFI83739.1 molecular chaperone TorD [Methylophaga nitratireducenticrescens]AUZ83862.1 molecular chaperone TorD [Methylophaga nitratireducenticrescens]
MEEIEETQWRAQTYALLANLLAAPPQQDLLDNIVNLKVTEPETSLGQGWLALIDAATQNNAEQIADEYQELFIGLAHGEVIPYGSYYQSGFLNEKPLARLRIDLGKLGLERQQDKAEPEDHIAGECDVMRLILTANGIPVIDDKTFFNAHLRPWAAKFFADLIHAKSAVFYKAVALLGKHFIEMELERLEQ